MKAFNIVRIKGKWQIVKTKWSLVEDMEKNCDSPFVDVCEWPDRIYWVMENCKVSWIRVEDRKLAEDVFGWILDTERVTKKNHIHWQPYPTDWMTVKSWEIYLEVLKKCE